MADGNNRDSALTPILPVLDALPNSGGRVFPDALMPGAGVAPRRACPIHAGFTAPAAIPTLADIQKDPQAMRIFTGTDAFWISAGQQIQRREGQWQQACLRWRTMPYRLLFHRTCYAYLYLKSDLCQQRIHIRQIGGQKRLALTQFGEKLAQRGAPGHQRRPCAMVMNENIQLFVMFKLYKCHQKEALMSSFASPFHSGERAMQQQAQTTELAEQIGPSIRPGLPGSFRQFIRQLPFLIVAGQDDDGQVWISAVTGTPGFATAPDPQTIVLHVVIAPEDPLTHMVKAGRALGLLAIEPASRRRIRLNGTIQRHDSAEIVVEVHETFGNCTKYIQARSYAPLTRATGAPTRQPFLSAAISDHLRQADTFFLGTAHPERGADASHRGGLPGFVRVIDDQHLVWPDYTGNGMFQSLGNLLINPRAGLLFLAPTTGDMLHLTGEALVEQRSLSEDDFPGAERLVRFTVLAAIHRPQAFPYADHFLGYSPVLPQ